MIHFVGGRWAIRWYILFLRTRHFKFDEPEYLEISKISRN
jgi:hypothetical protein